jgi:hypothetical protein
MFCRCCSLLHRNHGTLQPHVSFISLSFVISVGQRSAQNVKIITQDGKVTLRGTVKNDNEKQKIGEMAKKASGVKNVENLLTVSK